MQRLKSYGASEARRSRLQLLLPLVCCALIRARASSSTQVLLDGGSIKAKLGENKFFAKPRLALDAVGGASAVALADALQDGCPLVMCVARAPRMPPRVPLLLTDCSCACLRSYGCMSGKPAQFPWAHWTFKNLTVHGFNLRQWMNDNKTKARVRALRHGLQRVSACSATHPPRATAQIPLMLETLSKLVNADKLRIEFTEYELCDEFAEALEHAQETGRNTKVLLRVNDVGVTY